ncbi:MAB_1171c family putative transporter [Gordonia sp. NPDC003376]
MVQPTMAVSWSTGPLVVNVVALAAFVGALCWRIDQVRRNGGGLQAFAMTTSIAALTLAFAVSNHSASETLDDIGFVGLSRLLLYVLLAVGVAGLVIVFFLPGGRVTRERRAGVEAVPLVAALVGLQISLSFIPTDMRTASISEWTLKNWGFALFYLIASGYLAYGLGACVRSVSKYLRLADGYLRTSLSVLVAGLGLLAAGSIVQVVYVLTGALGLVDLPWILTASRVFAVTGLVLFLVGISYPMLQAKWQGLSRSRRRRRDAQAILPLWTLVTDAVPEVVLPIDGTLSPTALLHRRVVEIRDALSQLSPLLPAEFTTTDPEQQIWMLQMAVALRTREGASPGAVWPVLPESGGGLDGDAAPLLALSRVLAAAQGDDEQREDEQWDDEQCDDEERTSDEEQMSDED